MSNYDCTTSANQKLMANQVKYTMDGWVKAELDVLTDLKAVKGSAAAGTDTFDVITIPAGYKVNAVLVKCHVPVAGGSVSSPTVAVGDQSAASFCSAAAVDAAAQTTVIGNGTYLQAATAPYAITGGTYYATANTIRITLGGTWTGATAGRFEILVKMDQIGTSLFV